MRYKLKYMRQNNFLKLLLLILPLFHIILMLGIEFLQFKNEKSILAHRIYSLVHRIYKNLIS